MKPYTLTVTGDEQGIVYRALKAGLFAAKQQASIHVIGAHETVRKIEAAIEIMNRAPEGGYESDEERDAAHAQRFAAECALHGCD
jgi:hypothetical protein